MLTIRLTHTPLASLPSENTRRVVKEGGAPPSWRGVRGAAAPRRPGPWRTA
jgi:hypothetical protein